MNYKKVNVVLSKLNKLNDTLGLKFKIVIIKDSYFFFVDNAYVSKYFESGHKTIKGRYTGILSFIKEDLKKYNIFISEIFYNRVDSNVLFQRILYHILMYRNPEIFKLKYKKLKKQLQLDLSKILPKEKTADDLFINNMLSNKEDSTLFTDAKIIIPHISLYNLIDNFTESKNEIDYIKDIKSYLRPSEYMASNHTGHSHSH
jgi:hypothetical protein